MTHTHDTDLARAHVMLHGTTWIELLGASDGDYAAATTRLGYYMVVWLQVAGGAIAAGDVTQAMLGDDPILYGMWHAWARNREQDAANAAKARRGKHWGGYIKSCDNAGVIPMDEDAWEAAGMPTKATGQEIPEPQAGQAKRDKAKKDKPVQDKAQKRVYEHDSEPYMLAAYLDTRLCETAPAQRARTEADLQRWADTYRLMHERDGLSWALIDTVQNWATHDVCDTHVGSTWAGWASQIQSAEALRRSWDKIVTRIPATILEGVSS